MAEVDLLTTFHMTIMRLVTPARVIDQLTIIRRKGASCILFFEGEN